jgi:predicted transcriptional regulator
MPDDASLSTHVSLRVPTDILDALDKVAAAMERSRSWVMVQALKHYLESEGAEILDVAAGLAEAERGETVDFDEALSELRERVARRAGAKP